MNLEFLPYPAKNSTRSNLGFPATNAATTTFLPLRIALNMANFPCIAMSATEYFTVNQNTPSKTYPRTQVNKIIKATRHAKVILTQSCKIGFILYIDRKA